MRRDMSIFQIHYEPDTGKLIWKDYAGNRCVKPLTEAGYIHNTLGCRYVQVDKKLYKAHRLIWLWYYGGWPENHIDHINHNPSDNRICNLRDVTHIENHKNTSRRGSNKSGFTGVSFYKRDKNWQAYINVDTKRIHLGKFKNKEDAIKVRKEAEIKYGYHENHGKEKGSLDSPEKD